MTTQYWGLPVDVDEPCIIGELPRILEWRVEHPDAIIRKVQNYMEPYRGIEIQHHHLMIEIGWKDWYWAIGFCATCGKPVRQPVQEVDPIEFHLPPQDIHIYTCNHCKQYKTYTRRALSIARRVWTGKLEPDPYWNMTGLDMFKLLKKNEEGDEE